MNINEQHFCLRYARGQYNPLFPIFLDPPLISVPSDQSPSSTVLITNLPSSFPTLSPPISCLGYTAGLSVVSVLLVISLIGNLVTGIGCVWLWKKKCSTKYVEQ